MSDGDPAPPSGSGFDHRTIQAILPHRYPMLMVDRVLECHSGERIVAIKNVSANEPYFTGHFPGEPVMPGVLICEALAQAGALLAYRTPGGVTSARPLLLGGLDRVRFRRAVRPGDQLRLEVSLAKRRGSVWRLTGVALVDGHVAAEAEITAVEVDADDDR